MYDTSLTDGRWPFTWQLELAYYSEPETLKFCNPKWKKFVVKSFEKKSLLGPVLWNVRVIKNTNLTVVPGLEQDNLIDLTWLSWFKFNRNFSVFATLWIFYAKICRVPKKLKIQVWKDSKFSVTWLRYNPLTTNEYLY